MILPRTSEALYLLQRLRDEAHRFAITHQRSRRRKDIQSVLSEIPGLGAERIRVLLRHFGSVAALRKASADEITEVKGIGPKLAATIQARLDAAPTTEAAEVADALGEPAAGDPAVAESVG